MLYQNEEHTYPIRAYNNITKQTEDGILRLYVRPDIGPSIDITYGDTVIECTKGAGETNMFLIDVNCHAPMSAPGGYPTPPFMQQQPLNHPMHMNMHSYSAETSAAMQYHHTQLMHHQNTLAMLQRNIPQMQPPHLEYYIRQPQTSDSTFSFADTATVPRPTMEPDSEPKNAEDPRPAFKQMIAEIQQVLTLRHGDVTITIDMQCIDSMIRLMRNPRVRQ